MRPVFLDCNYKKGSGVSSGVIVPPVGNMEEADEVDRLILPLILPFTS